MKTSTSIFLALFFFNFLQSQTVLKIDENFVQYSEKELVFFLDSVAKIKVEPLMKKVSEKSDNAFNNQLKLKKNISIANFKKLKESIESQEIPSKLAIKIFGKNNMKSRGFKESNLVFSFYSLTTAKSNFEEFAIYFNESHEIFFIKNQKVIGRHIIQTKLFPDLQFYKDSDGKTVVYYDYELMNGSGIWQSNYFFYKIDGEKMLPILNQIHQSNLSNVWSNRIFSLQSSIESTLPLAFKINYEISFLNEEKEVKFINNTAFIKYLWDDKTQQLVGDFIASKLNEAQLASFYIEGSDLLFLKSFYPIIRNNLRDEHLKGTILKYINEVINTLSY